MRDLAMHIMDIAQNSLVAKATTITIGITENIEEDTYRIIIEDNGIGMTQDYVATITDPYTTTRTTRKVGLGIPLLKQNAERTGGNLEIESSLGVGTTVKATFSLFHPDRPPVGDIAGTVVLLCGANPQVTFKFDYITSNGEYNFNTDEVNDTLEGISISDPSVIRFLKEMINENLELIGSSK
jgi:anti-sigma regulatory factor (Ser/Thr protein kinase)